MSAEMTSLQARARVHAALGDPARLAIIDALTLGDSSPGEIGAAPTCASSRRSSPR
jgi:hypothetical protein